MAALATTSVKGLGGQFGSARGSLQGSRAAVGAPSRPRTVNVEAAKKKSSKKARDIRVVITLECTEQRGTDVKGMSRYTTEKSRRNDPDRMELMKYNPFLQRHTLHREIKSKK